MPCPVCNLDVGGNSDHRMCLVQLFRDGTIKSSAEWERMAKKPITIFKGRGIRRLRVEAQPTK